MKLFKVQLFFVGKNNKDIDVYYMPDDFTSCNKAVNVIEKYSKDGFKNNFKNHFVKKEIPNIDKIEAYIYEVTYVNELLTNRRMIKYIIFLKNN